MSGDWRGAPSDAGKRIGLAGHSGLLARLERVRFCSREKGAKSA